MNLYSYAGTQYWRYDNENDHIYTMDTEGNRYPMLISEGFPGVTGPVDAALYDRRDQHIYFFKGPNVSIFTCSWATRDNRYKSFLYSILVILRALRVINTRNVCKQHQIEMGQYLHLLLRHIENHLRQINCYELIWSVRASYI